MSLLTASDLAKSFGPVGIFSGINLAIPIRLVHAPAICLAPQYLAEELLRLEGFSDVSYVEIRSGEPIDVIYAGRADINAEAAPAAVYRMADRTSAVALGGIHPGCFELYGNDSVRSYSRP